MKTIVGLIFILLIISLPLIAGIPPTFTLGSGDTTHVNTYEIQTPTLPITHTGGIASVGTALSSGGLTHDTFAARKQNPGFFEDFITPISNPFGENCNTGSSGGSIVMQIPGNTFAGVNVTNGHPGLVSIFTNAAPAAGSYSTMYCGGGLRFDSTLGSFYTESMIFVDVTPSASDDYIVASGFANVGNAAWGTGNFVGAYFLFQRANATSSTHFVCRVSQSNVTFTDVDSTISLTAGNYYSLAVTLTTGGHALFSINGTQRCDISTNMPTNTQDMYVVNNNTWIASTTFHRLLVDYVWFENHLGTSR